jgi:AcrR family transcriptional regulator
VQPQPISGPAPTSNIGSARSTSRGRATRRRILDAATELIAAADGTTLIRATLDVRAVAKAAGLSGPSALYRHFDTVEDLHRAVLEHALASEAITELADIGRALREEVAGGRPDERRAVEDLVAELTQRMWEVCRHGDVSSALPLLLVLAGRSSEPVEPSAAQTREAAAIDCYVAACGALLGAWDGRPPLATDHGRLAATLATLSDGMLIRWAFDPALGDGSRRRPALEPVADDEADVPARQAPAAPSTAGAATVTPAMARRTWRRLEPVHGIVYFAPEVQARYDALGLRCRHLAYFASRSAAMGAVGAEVVTSTFFHFNPELVRRSIPSVWDDVPPAAILEARIEGADLALRRALGDTVGSPELEEAAALARRAASAACERPEGRPIFAAHAALPWPSEPHLVLFHAQTLLREFRGDAHVAALTLEGLTGIEALVVHAASGEVPAEELRISRGWEECDWSRAVDSLRRRGLVTASGDLALTERGAAHRRWVEDRTDASTLPAYEGLGGQGCDRLGEVGRALSRAIIESGLFGGGLLAHGPGMCHRPTG